MAVVVVLEPEQAPATTLVPEQAPARVLVLELALRDYFDYFLSAVDHSGLEASIAALLADAGQKVTAAVSLEVDLLDVVAQCWDVGSFVSHDYSSLNLSSAA